MWLKIIYSFSIVLLLFSLNSCKSVENTQSETQFMGDVYAVTDSFLEAKRYQYQGKRTQAIEGFRKCIKMNPQHDASYFELARIHEFENSDKAVEYTQQAIQIAPENIWYREFLMRIYQQQKDFEKAIGVAKDLIKLRPDEKNYYYQWANLCINSKDYKQALAAYDKILQSFGYEEGVLKQQKQIYLKNGDYKKAILVLEELIANHPENKEYYGMIAEIYQNTGKAEQAMIYYQKVKEIDPEDGFVHFALADYYRGLGQKEKAHAELREGMKSPSLSVDVKVKVLLQMMDMSEKDSTLTPRFEELLNIAGQTHQEAPKVLALRADYLMGKGEVENAILYFRQIIAIDSSKYIIWEQLLLAEYEVGNFSALKDESNRALKLFPQQANLYYFNSLAYAHENDWRKVKERMKMGNNFNYDKNAGASFLALQAKAEMQLGEKENGIANYSRALRYDPNNAEIMKDFAYSLASHDLELSTALSYAQKALELESGKADYVFVYAYCLFKDGQKEEALKWLAPALKDFPENKDLKLLDMEINKDE